MSANIEKIKQETKPISLSVVPTHLRFSSSCPLPPSLSLLLKAPNRTRMDLDFQILEVSLQRFSCVLTVVLLVVVVGVVGVVFVVVVVVVVRRVSSGG